MSLDLSTSLTLTFCVAFSSTFSLCFLFHRSVLLFSSSTQLPRTQGNFERSEWALCSQPLEWFRIISPAFWWPVSAGLVTSPGLLSTALPETPQCSAALGPGSWERVSALPTLLLGSPELGVWACSAPCFPLFFCVFP